MSANATASADALADSAARVRLLVLDVDGVLTDGRLYYGARGEALKVFHVRDGLGLKLLAEAGIIVAVISGRRCSMNRTRCRELGIKHLLQGVADKLAAFQRLRVRLGVSPGMCACVGDDVTDVALMREVGLSFAVADAHPQARGTAQVVTQLPGGGGAVREICDFLLEARRRAGAA